jgi:hypothetical protein
MIIYIYDMLKPNCIPQKNEKVRMGMRQYVSEWKRVMWVWVWVWVCVWVGEGENVFLLDEHIQKQCLSSSQTGDVGHEWVETVWDDVAFYEPNKIPCHISPERGRDKSISREVLEKGHSCVTQSVWTRDTTYKGSEAVDAQEQSEKRMRVDRWVWKLSTQSNRY